MTPARALELSPVFTAFANKKTIQLRKLSESKWYDMATELWDGRWLDDHEYRIKPELRYIPWTVDNAPFMVVVESKVYKEYLMVFIFDGKKYKCRTCTGGSITLTADQMFTDYTHVHPDLSTTPCGTPVEDSESPQ